MTRSKQTIVLEIKEKLSAFPNSQIIREISTLVDELANNNSNEKQPDITKVLGHPAAGVVVTASGIKKICRRGFQPIKSDCVACPYSEHCNDIIK